MPITFIMATKGAGNESVDDNSVARLCLMQNKS